MFSNREWEGTWTFRFRTYIFMIPAIRIRGYIFQNKFLLSWLWKVWVLKKWIGVCWSKLHFIINLIRGNFVILLIILYLALLIFLTLALVGLGFTVFTTFTFTHRSTWHSKWKTFTVSFHTSWFFTCASLPMNKICIILLQIIFIIIFLIIIFLIII